NYYCSAYVGSNTFLF
nr:immunoglobulin light chain junction region [Macaca mulatta]MOW69209.1 immunoglobulin light chain junction region [Macaca mulatta]MOW69218.1 immunoglobulin light chain junction region [Macaca mulatta]MOW69318.1 immunoglobulin light chain junction region [Macaca mulatta]MOW70200.1 immunoglobulin light chain junction region [Macaca mulatta]